MANPHKGEVSFEAGGKRYVFKIGTYAQAILERRVKTTWPKFISRPQEEWGVDDTLAMFWAGLHRQHKLSEEQVADLIDEIGIDKLGEIMAEAVRLSTEQGDVGANAADPPVAKVIGIGTQS